MPRAMKTAPSARSVKENLLDKWIHIQNGYPERTSCVNAEHMENEVLCAYITVPTSHRRNRKNIYRNFGSPFLICSRGKDHMGYYANIFRIPQPLHIAQTHTLLLTVVPDLGCPKIKIGCGCISVSNIVLE